MIPKSARTRAEALSALSDSHEIVRGADNECLENLSDQESAVLRRCAGCGRGFVPAGRQKYCSHACYAASLRVPIEARFWTRVNAHGPAPAHRPDLGPCWLFTGKARLREYGSVAGRKHGKPWPQYAHRLAWELARGPIPHGLSVLHRCDVPLCCNPDHLFLGTQLDNMRDASRKGRLRGRRRERLVQAFGACVKELARTLDLPGCPFELVCHVDLPIVGEVC